MGKVDPETRFAIAREHEGAALGAVVRASLGCAWSVAKQAIASGRVSLDGVLSTDPGTRVHAGQTLSVSARPVRAVLPGKISRDVVVHIDPHLVVVNKPSGVSTVPFEEGERGALVDQVRVLLNRAYGAGPNAPLFVVHRIDKETSGLVVFARTWLAKRHLAGLFRTHTIEREYLALVNGALPRDRMVFDTHLVENRGDGLRGSAKQSGLGVRAVTHVEVLEKFARGVTLARCRLETGRTHQIRIHLAESGHPLVGERVYSRHFAGPMHAAPRLMLHAAHLGFSHPAQHDEIVRFDQPVPEDFAALLASLRSADAAR